VGRRITEEVLAAARAGDGDALVVIWRELAPAVAGYLTARGVPDAEGVTSDVFVAVLPRLGELTGGVSGLRTFVFSVAHARMVDDTRRRARQPTFVELDQLLHDRATESAEREALERVGTAGVQDLLDRLSPDHREVLALRIVADLSLEQVATVMRRSTGSVKQLQRRALIAVRALVEADGPADTGRSVPIC
jgi:RNA polymerase sigma-70 factor (ECF subfamily)